MQIEKKFVVSPQHNQIMHKTSKLAEYYKSFSLFLTGYSQIYEDLTNAPLPRIISRGETIRAAYGEKVELPCRVEQLGIV